jgi:hypothetical protein
MEEVIDGIERYLPEGTSDHTQRRVRLDQCRGERGLREQISETTPNQERKATYDD